MEKIGQLCEQLCRLGHRNGAISNGGLHGQQQQQQQQQQHQQQQKVKVQAILQKKNVLDFNDYAAGLLDSISEFFGRSVSVQLVSSVHLDHNLGSGRLSKPAQLKKWLCTKQGIATGDSYIEADMDWDPSLGPPGAILVKNEHQSEFFLKSMTVHLPENQTVHFDCYSWVYSHSKDNKQPRVFFSNKSYLPADTPLALKGLREEELKILRGDGTGERKEHERIYDYALYNDLGDPDHKISRPVLGGSQHPYPRRCRTGRPSTKTDPHTESRTFLLDLDVYVPRDERFGHLKMADFLAYALKSVSQVLLPLLESVFDKTPNEFDSMKDVMNLYYKGIPLPNNHALESVRRKIPFEFFKQLFHFDSARLLRYPVPQAIQYDRDAWRTDEEFAREVLAGVNPLVIQRLTEFPPKSQLDDETYGPRESSITESHILHFLDGLTVKQAISEKRLFILDHYDTVMPYVNRINSQNGVKIYATRTLLFLNSNGKLTPAAIELCLPPTADDPATRRVFTPAHEGPAAVLWFLAKVYASVNDSGHHQLISHWLLTHAVTEPMAIATNRQLSAMHPVHRLLKPHFRDTLNINALARHILINGGGLFERTVFPGKFSMELSSDIYHRYWRFDHQALPLDLLKRGMAEEDETKPHGLRLLIEDYPYAVDGLEIWAAIETWVGEYVALYYADDDAVSADAELQAWWAEIRERGHGDKGHEPWWYAMDCVRHLHCALTIIIWVASALHAAVNFGQYAYAGFMPNRPTLSRRLLPPAGSPEETALLEGGADAALLRTVLNQLQTTLGIALIEVLSRHSSDEVYLGQREGGTGWTADAPALAAAERFAQELRRIEQRINDRNADPALPNRRGPVHVDYTLLFPGLSDERRDGGLTGRGIPNSVSI